MKKYIVLALAITGHGRVIHRSGDTVTESNFEPGAIDGLIANGYIKEKDETGVPSEAEEEAALRELMEIGKENLKNQGVTAVQALAKVKEDLENNDDTDSGDTQTGEVKSEILSNTGGKKTFKSIEEPELKAYLTHHGVEFDSEAKKKVLYELYANHEPAAK